MDRGSSKEEFGRDIDAEIADLAQERRTRRSVHLRLKPEVMEYFVESCGGRGHISNMQDVLESFVRYQKAKMQAEATPGNGGPDA